MYRGEGGHNNLPRDRDHPIKVRGGQVSDWEESQMPLAALAVSELPAALQ